MGITSDVTNILSQGIQEVDLQVISLRQVQVELVEEIDRLQADLQVFLLSADFPSGLESPINRLVVAKKRLMTANKALEALQSRLEIIVKRVLSSHQ